MTDTTLIAYTPEQTAKILQLSKNTIYELIAKGEIIAKRIGKVYRVSAKSLSFVSTGLDNDFFEADQEDRKSLELIEKEITSTRTQS